MGGAPGGRSSRWEVGFLCRALLQAGPWGRWRWMRGTNPCNRKEPNIHDQDQDWTEGEHHTFIFH